MEARRQKRDYATEFRIVLPDGIVKYVEGIIHHVISEEGELIELVGTNADVTERKRARDGHERLRHLESDLAHMNRLSVMGFLHHENQRDGDGAIDLPVDHRCPRGPAVGRRK